MSRKVTKPSTISYFVHGFMLDMGLSMHQTALYAILYSFTNVAPGIYYGNYATLAKATCSSIKTVQRCIGELCKMGYVERVTVEEDGVSYRGLRTTERGVERTVIAEEEAKDEGEDIVGDAVKRVVERNRAINSTPKREKLSAMEGTVVEMSYEQQTALIAEVGVVEFENYVNRLDRLIMESIYTGAPKRFYNHYKIIKNWIREDFKVG